MSFFWLTFIAIHLVSVVFFALSMLLVMSYRKKNHFIETNRTLLLGFIRLEHVILVYGASVVVYIAGSMFLVFYLL